MKIKDIAIVNDIACRLNKMDLKACPFCGGRPGLKFFYHNNIVAIACNECGAETRSVAPTPDAANVLANAWERRTPF